MLSIFFRHLSFLHLSKIITKSNFCLQKRCLFGFFSFVFLFLGESETKRARVETLQGQLVLEEVYLIFGRNQIVEGTNEGKEIKQNTSKNINGLVASLLEA